MLRKHAYFAAFVPHPDGHIYRFGRSDRGLLQSERIFRAEKAESALFFRKLEGLVAKVGTLIAEVRTLVDQVPTLVDQVPTLIAQVRTLIARVRSLIAQV